MQTTIIIREIVNRAVPLDLTCAIKRAEQNALRARLRLDIEDLLRKVERLQGYEPRTQLK